MKQMSNQKKVFIFCLFMIIYFNLIFNSCVSNNGDKSIQNSVAPEDKMLQVNNTNGVNLTDVQDPRIISFGIMAASPMGEIDDEKGIILIKVPRDADISTYKNIGMDVQFEGVRIDPPRDALCDFSASVFVTVFSKNGNSKTYEVRVLHEDNEHNEGNDDNVGNDKSPEASYLKDIQFLQCEVPNIFNTGKSGTISVSKTEITQNVFESTLKVNNSKIDNPMLPVTNLTWYETIIFCNKLSEFVGKTPVYIVNGVRTEFPNVPGPGDLEWEIEVDKSADGYRLPTQAELKVFLAQDNDELKIDDSIEEWFFDWPQGKRRDRSDPKMSFRIVCK